QYKDTLMNCFRIAIEGNNDDLFFSIVGFASGEMLAEVLNLACKNDRRYIVNILLETSFPKSDCAANIIDYAIRNNRAHIIESLLDKENEEQYDQIIGGIFKSDIPSVVVKLIDMRYLDAELSFK